MKRGLHAEAHDGQVRVWKTFTGTDGSPHSREQVCDLDPQEALDASSSIRLAAQDAYTQNLAPGVR